MVTKPKGFLLVLLTDGLKMILLLNEYSKLCSSVYIPCILAYKSTLKQLPQNEEFCKNSHISRLLKYQIPWCVVWANNKRVSMCNALMKVH